MWVKKMLEIKNKQFYLDEKPFGIYSGTMHYFRIPHEYWRDRLLKLKAAGFNTVETYVAWNVHEPKEKEWNFEGQNDLAAYIKTAAEVGLYVIVRPGPYICAEWDFGGFPAWLLKYDDMMLRCYSKPYIGFVKRYYEKLMAELKPLLYSNGGPIIAMQVENEYGSYGRDKKYLNYLRDLIVENGIDSFLFTSDGESRFHLSGGGIDGVFKVVNFGGYPSECFADLRKFQPDAPLMCGEMWCGWFDHFREKHHGGGSDEKAKETVTRIVNEFFDENASFNFYMFHGGTNFGYMAGANYAHVYQPTTTSYDYDAPLNEFGDYTAKYFAMREAVCKRRNIELPELPARPETQKIGKVTLSQSAELLGNLKKVSKHFYDHIPHYMEHYGQSFGMILYHTEIEGDYPETTIGADGVHDIAYVYVNKKLVGRFDRSDALLKNGKTPETDAPESCAFTIPAFKGKIEVDILVEAQGRINFATHLHDRKGLGSVSIGGQYTYGFDIYTIPIENYGKLKFKSGVDCECPAYFKGSFKASKMTDCFVEMKGFNKGYVFVNGKNLGRYWSVGPQKALYLPGVWLKEENEIVVFETESFKNPYVTITDKPSFK